MKKPATATKASGRRARPALGTGRTVAKAASRYAAGIGYTSMKHILACVDGTQSDRCLLDYASQIALRFGAHIDVLHVRFDSRGATTDKRRAGIADRLLAEPVEKHVSEAAAHARRHFEEWHALCRLPVLDSGIAAPRPSIQWREILGYESEVIARLGRLSDLILIARSGAPSLSTAALETALFESGRPVLMVPGGTAVNLFHRPLIAWNGSREAARAVHFALPILCQFTGCVEVFAAPESKHHTDTDELLRYLSWHGISAARISADEAAGMNLLAQASAIGAGLIVMGAYTHGHYRQFLFGGMTRHVMEHAAIPVLFAH
jgi:nucleotide-binding universal stress UspA family protein